MANPQFAPLRLSPNLRKRCEQLLLLYDEFRHYDRLVDLIARATNYSLAGRLQRRDAPVDLIEESVSYLLRLGRLRDGRFVLLCVLEALHQKYADEPLSRDDELHAIIDAIRADLSGEQTHSPAPRPAPAPAGKEANPTGGRMQSIVETKRLLECAQAVAHISVAAVGSEGTAWLAAPGLALTCRHVIENLGPLDYEERDLDIAARSARLTFGYTVDGRGVEYGVEGIAAVSAPESPLDYALLRLRDRADFPLAQWGQVFFDLDAPLDQQTQIYVIQHPLGEAEKYAVGRYVGPAPVTGRVLYTTATERGTSGAPALNGRTYRAVALHHGYEQGTPYNLGVLLRSIIDDIADRHPDLSKKEFAPLLRLNKE